MRMSEKGLKQLALFEGLVKVMYRDVAGLPTIGVGHLLTREELRTGKILIGSTEHQWKLGLCEELCLALLAQDVEGFERCVSGAVTVPLDAHEFDMLVSLAFNIGRSAFTASTVLRKLNQGDRHGCAAAFSMWRKAGGRVVQGLVKRRAQEAHIFLGGYDGI